VLGKAVIVSDEKQKLQQVAASSTHQAGRNGHPHRWPTLAVFLSAGHGKGRRRLCRVGAATSGQGERSQLARGR
jgi:hypothetical protein